MKQRKQDRLIANKKQAVIESADEIEKTESFLDVKIRVAGG